MIGKGRAWKTAAIAAAATLAPFAAARAEVTIEELQQRLDEQEQKIRVLERRLELQDESAATAKETAAVVSAGAKGFSLRSADSANQLKIRGVLHVDGRYTNDDEETAVYDTVQATRARPIIEGTFADRYDFRFTPDFGQGRTVIQDAYVTARLHPHAAVTVGKFKAPVGLERLQSASDIRFVSRAFPTSLAPNRDFGLQLAGEFGAGRLSYAAAVLNGAIDGGSAEALGDVDVNDDKEYALRLFSHPFAGSEGRLGGLGIGIAGTWTDQTGTATLPLLPAFRTPEGVTFFRYRGRHDADARGRRAHAHRAAVLLLCRPPRHSRRVHRGVAGRLARDRRGLAQRHGRHHGLAARRLLVPDRRGRHFPRLQAAVHILAGRGLGRTGTGRARAPARNRRSGLRRRRGFLRGSGQRPPRRRPAGPWD